MASKRTRRLIVPEVVQSSAMDCGPASLKAVLDGFGLNASYGRLREACQTEVDGTSIDTLEEVAVQLGLKAEQVMIPPEHLLLEEAEALPALVVVRLPSGLTHFVVVWNHYRGLVQLMDPGTGRLWVSRSSFLRDLYLHTHPVPAEAWRDWAGSQEFLDPLVARMSDLGVPHEVAEEMIKTALQSPHWQPIAALDAAVRMAASLRRCKAVRRGKEAEVIIRRYSERGAAEEFDADVIPGPFWSVKPAARATSDEGEILDLHGAVLIRFLGLAEEGTPAGEEAPVEGEPEREERVLPPELAAVLEEPPATPGRDLLRMLREDGVLAPLMVILGLAAGAGTVILQALLFRGLLEAGTFLGLVHQRIGAIVALVLMLAAATLLDLPLAGAALRLGRRLETRLRIAFLEKIPRLADRYFHSRLSSDMAERAHSAHVLRRLPDLGFRLVRSFFLLLATTTGIIWLDPRAAVVATAVAAISVALPLAAQRFLVELDLRLRTHAGALTRYYLDAMLGLMAVRCHGAGKAVRREHESLLVDWSRANVALLRVATVVQAVLALSGAGLAIWLLMDHLTRAGGSGMVLLLVFWALSLPNLGESLAATIRQYPAQRNITLRLLEPLGAPDETEPPAEAPAEQATAGEPAAGGMAIRMHDVTVRAGGHTILEEIDVELPAGAHVAVVGPSGAGKSSLVGTLLGWHRPSVGELQVDGEPLGGEVLQRLRRQTAWVDPAVQLFNRSFIDNLRYGTGDRATVPLSEVLERAALHPVVERLPNGLQAVLGEGGGLVSGGEGQRVRLGRGLVRPDVRLVILDEPFRGLDREQRRLLLAAARDHWRHATLICITHDVGETLAFDRVLVIERGRIVEDDAPATLQQNSGSRYAGLLQAEQKVREQLWDNPDWRHLHLQGGRMREASGGRKA